MVGNDIDDSDDGDDDGDDITIETLLYIRHDIMS